MSTRAFAVQHACTGRSAGWSRLVRDIVGLAAMLLAATPGPAVADDYTWNGTNALWTSSNWVTTTGTTTFPVGSSGTNTAIINAGTVSFAGSDTFGNGTTTSSPVIRVGTGATLASNGSFNTIWNLNLGGGGLLANGGVNGSFPAFQLGGTVLVDGTSGATISTGAGSNNMINVGGQGNATLTFNVADVTSSSAADLTVSTVLQNAQVSGGPQAGALTKTGAGTLVLSATNTYTGATTINGGLLQIASGGALASAGNVNSTAGGQLSIAGSVTMAGNTYFAVGNGILNTTGTTSIDGGSLAVGTNAFLIGGSRASLGTTGGLGTFVVNSGTVTVGAAGGTQGGQDANALYLNPYNTSGTSQLILNGGVLSTARSISDGGGGRSVMAFNGGTLRFAASISAGGAGTNVIHSGGAVIDTNGFNGTLDRALASGTGATAGGLTKIGSGTLALSAANTYTGPTTVTAGVLQVASGGSLSSAGNVNSISGGRLSIAGSVTMAANTYFAVGSGVADTSGTTTIDGGTLAVGNNAFLIGGGRGDATSSRGTGMFVVNSGTVTVAAGGGTGGGSDTSAVWLNPYGTTGTSSLVLNGGVFSTARGIRDGGSGSTTMGFNGGTLRAAASTDLLPASQLAISIHSGGAVIDSNAFSATISNALATGTGATAGGLTKLGSGTLALSAANTFSGTTRIAAGVLAISNASSLQNSTLNLDAADSGAVTFAQNSTLGGLAGSRNLDMGTRTLSIGNNNQSTTYSGTLSNGALTKLGSGTLGLSAANTYTGPTIVSGGVLQIASGGALTSTGNVNSISGGQLSVVGSVTMAANTYFAVGSGVASTSGTTTIDGGTLAVGGNAFLIGGGRGDATGTRGTGRFILNSGTVTVAAGAGTGGGSDTSAVWLNPYGTTGTSSLVLNGGVFSTARSIRDGGTGATTMGFNGGTLRAAASVDLVPDSQLAVSIHSGGAVIDSGTFSTTISNRIVTGTGATAGGLTKIGSGRLTLSATNTYTGLTTVSEGVLAVNGSIAGALDVSIAATLAGVGTLNGFVTVADGGIVAPGNSPGTLTMASGLSLADSSILAFELNATNVTVGGGINDLINVTGNFTLNGILDVTGSGDFSTVADNTKWRLFNYSGGTFTDAGLSLGTMPSLGANGRYFQIDTSTTGEVNLVVVPEPGAIALAAIGLAVAGWRASRRRSAVRS
jgi:fibronectin-binding autotransporter adhesin